MPITNVNPIITESTTIYWITDMSIRQNCIMATLAPSDGTYIISNVSLTKQINDQSSEGVAIINSIMDGIQSVSHQTQINYIKIIAHDTQRPVQLISFGKPVAYVVKDLFAFLTANPDIALVYENVLTYLGGVVNG